jgi:prolipoprotein diacylglyceryl transferase
VFAPVILASIPSPSTAVWYLGPIPLRAYALCIIAGIIVACIVTDRRMRSRGAPPWTVLDIAMWAVPFGIVGARIYHVLSSPDNYFGHGWDGFVNALKIWEGGLGIWGGVAGGALGAWIACKLAGLSFTFVADCIAIGLPLAQAIGRLGNWFNNELYGGQTNLPWGLQVHQMSTGAPGDPEIGKALTGPDGKPLLLDGTYHPTFLYELLWNLGVAGLVYWVDKKYKLGKGRAFALYAMAYTAGRAWIEMMRTDEAEIIGGLRLNVWTSIIVFLGALAFFVLRKGPQEFVIPAIEGKGYRTVTEEEFLAHKAGDSGDDGDSGDGPSATSTDETEAPDRDQVKDEEKVEHDAAASKD